MDASSSSPSTDQPQCAYLPAGRGTALMWPLTMSTANLRISRRKLARRLSMRAVGHRQRGHLEGGTMQAWNFLTRTSLRLRWTTLKTGRRSMPQY